MKILTFNVENLFLDPLFAYQHKATLKEKNQLERMCKILFEIDADILGLQEVGGKNSFQILRDYLQKHYQIDYEIVTHPGNSDRGIEVGYLIKQHLTYNATSHHQVQLDLTDQFSKEYKKIARNFLQLTLLKDEKKFHFLLIHLKSARNLDSLDPGGVHKRKSEIRALLKLSKKLEQDAPVIILGDFNTPIEKTNNELLKLHESFFELCDYLELPEENRVTYIGRHRNQAPAHILLDTFFISKNLKTLIDKRESGVYRPQKQSLKTLKREDFPSDHFPVLLKLMTS